VDTFVRLKDTLIEGEMSRNMTIIILVKVHNSEDRKKEKNGVKLSQNLRQIFGDLYYDKKTV
jgi:hypothetical protein